MELDMKIIIREFYVNMLVTIQDRIQVSGCHM